MDEEGGGRSESGRKQGLFLPLDDGVLSEDDNPPRSALTQGSVRDDGSVAQAATPRSSGAMAARQRALLWRATVRGV
jgi:hypothetical protein